MWLGVAVLLVLSYVPAVARAALARLTGMRVSRVMIGFGPRLATWTSGKTRWQLHAIPIGAFSQVAGLHATDAPVAPNTPDAFYGRPWFAQLLVLLAGVLGLLVFGAAVGVAGNLAFGIVDVDSSHVVVNQALPGRPAAAGGVREGDEIVAVDSTPVTQLEALMPALNATHGPVRLTIRRDGAEQIVVVVPEDVGGARRIGVSLMGGFVARRVPVGRAIGDGVLFPVRYAHFFVTELVKQMMAWTPVASAQGTLGVLRAVRQSQHSGARAVVAIIVVLAVQFALWLLLPVPPTDGGRVLVWIFRRRRASSVPAVDAGIISSTDARINAACVVMLVLVGITAVLTLVAAGFGVAVAFVFAGLLRRRPWAWLVTRRASAILAGSGLLTWLLQHDPADLAALALFLTIALLARAPSVRRLYGLCCPVCGAIEGEPVLGAARALQCGACGSSWTATQSRQPAQSAASA